MAAGDQGRAAPLLRQVGRGWLDADPWLGKPEIAELAKRFAYVA